jgi:hypothetical protein
MARAGRPEAANMRGKISRCRSDNNLDDEDTRSEKAFVSQCAVGMPNGDTSRQKA